MCKLIRDGGQRCAGHTRERAKEAFARFERGGSTPMSDADHRALREYASTPSGRDDLLAIAEDYDNHAAAQIELEDSDKYEGLAHEIRSIVKQGEDMREANKEFARQLREAEGLSITDEQIDKDAIEVGSPEAVEQAYDEVQRGKDIQETSEMQELAALHRVDAVLNDKEIPGLNNTQRASLLDDANLAADRVRTGRGSNGDMHAHREREITELKDRLVEMGMNDDEEAMKTARELFSSANNKNYAHDSVAHSNAILNEAFDKCEPTDMPSEQARTANMEDLDQITAEYITAAREGGDAWRNAIDDEQAVSLEFVPGTNGKDLLDRWTARIPEPGEPVTGRTPRVNIQSIPPVERAALVSAAAHRGQKDKIGVPYKLHPQGLVQSMESLPEYYKLSPKQREQAVVAAYLHDVVEDTPYTSQHLREMGFSKEAIDAVTAVTAPKGMPKDEYYERVMAAGPIARVVKLADLSHNNLPSRRASLPGAPGVPLAEDGRDQYTKLGKKYAKAYKALGSTVPPHLQEFDE